MGKYASHSALHSHSHAPKNSDMKINTSQKPYFRNRSSLLLLFFIYLFIFYCGNHDTLSMAHGYFLSSIC